MLSTNRAKPNDLFNFQGLRKRIIIAPDYSSNDERLKTITSEDENKQIDNEYNELDLIGEQFEAYVRPSIERSQWISDRKHERNEIDRLGDIIHFYEHKPNLTEFEKRVYKRLTRQDRSVQTDQEPEKNLNTKQNRNRVPVIRLPTPLAMERVENFLIDNHWRLVDLFRTLDRDKSWTVVKEDFMHLAEKEQLNITDAQADELITCFCREVDVPLNYKRFARGRALYKKNIRESASKTPSSLDTQLESDTSTTPSSSHLQLPPTDISHQYPTRDSSSSYSRSTKSSLAKHKRVSVSTVRTESKLSTYE
ncbi:unnamed protein product [Rotaria sp. Silwood1]|nr:unnamed protein product [Rotaria sp. Silwood1]CAF1189734.1 unnamed protein product [Rotaria sp. Silwood1]CAF3470528.1 unnamed protein product [Rotaria sp. Silwood1]CAF4851913.1 unnamed protein product [Rotaria sp. Silwood1]